MTTVGEARVGLLKIADKGGRCPCCDSYIKIYKRKVHAEMAQFLIRLRKAGGGWHHTRELGLTGPKASTDGAYLEHWGLLEHDRGRYKITEKGVDFVANKVRVAQKVHLLHNEVVGWSAETTNILEALGSKFDYYELMAD